MLPSLDKLKQILALCALSTRLPHCKPQIFVPDSLCKIIQAVAEKLDFIKPETPTVKIEIVQ